MNCENRTNSTVADPTGRAFANRIANSLLPWSARYRNRLGWEDCVYVETFSLDEFLSTFCVFALTLAPPQTITVATFSDGINAHDSVLGTVHKNAASSPRLSRH